MLTEHWLSKLPTSPPFNVFENNDFFPRPRPFSFPNGANPQRILLHFSYDLQRAAHTFPGRHVVCANVIVKNNFNNLLMKHEMSRNQALKPFVQDGLDFEKINDEAIAQIIEFTKKYPATIAKPSWGKAGTGILTSCDGQEIAAHVNSLKNKYVCCSVYMPFF